MIPGIKVWQEPHGGWTAACYNTPDCVENDWGGDWIVIQNPIRKWMDINTPTAYFDYRTGLAEFGYDDRAAEAAVLFKLRFQGE